MKVRLVCSCGLLLSSRGTSVLVDAPNADFPPFYRFQAEEEARLLAANAPYDGLCGLIFTHLHPDHFDAARVKALMAARADVPVFAPDEACASRTFSLGAFTVECHRFAHTPAPQFAALPHDVLLISDDEKTVYITSDAAPEIEKHREILRGRPIDAAFWNSQYLSYPQTRALLRECAAQNFIYHMPSGELGESAIGRKCEKNLLRYGAEVQNVRVLCRYPSEPTIA